MVSVYGVVISIMYIVYLCIVEQTNIYRYGIYLILYIIILVLDTMLLKKCAKNSYVIGILLMIMVMVIFTGEVITRNTIIATLLAIFFYLLLFQMKQRKRKNKKSDKQIANELRIGFFLGTFHIILLMLGGLVHMIQELRGF